MIRRRALRISLLGQAPLLDGPLVDAVNLDGSAWVFEAEEGPLEEGGGPQEEGAGPQEGGPRLVVTLCKAEVSTDRFWGYPMYERGLMEEEAGAPGVGEHEKDEPALSSFGNAGVEWVNGKE